jgi:hypothetical protein
MKNMTINGRLLKKTKEAGARLASAESEVESARREYHALVRRIHLAGASLREIAQALELSHQRVQQIVDGAGGSWWRRIWRSRNVRGNLTCTFCGRSQDAVARLIAGPKVFICGECVAAAEQALSGGSPAAVRIPLAPAGDNSKTRCSFCSKRRSAGRPVLTGPASICGECLDVCRQILIDSQP